MTQSITDLVDDIIDEANTALDSMGEYANDDIGTALTDIIGKAESIQDKASDISSLVQGLECYDIGTISEEDLTITT